MSDYRAMSSSVEVHLGSLTGASVAEALALDLVEVGLIVLLDLVREGAVEPPVKSASSS